MARQREKARAQSKTHTSTAEMLRSLEIDEEIVQEVETALTKSRLARSLSALRSSRGVSQQCIADELGLTQSAVSKIEKGFDESLTLRDIEAYARVLGFGVEVRFVKPMTLAERIRDHSAQLSSLVHELVRKVKGDQSLSHGVLETVNRMLLSVGEAIGRLRHVTRDEASEPSAHTALLIVGEEDPNTSPVKTVVS
jgi:transcriptional regulator with XRE-family HTH domain